MIKFLLKVLSRFSSGHLHNNKHSAPDKTEGPETNVKMFCHISLHEVVRFLRRSSYRSRVSQEPIQRSCHRARAHAREGTPDFTADLNSR